MATQKEDLEKGQIIEETVLPIGDDGAEGEGSPVSAPTGLESAKGEERPPLDLNDIDLPR